MKVMRLIFATFFSMSINACIVTKPQRPLDAEQTGLELIDQGTLWLRAAELDRAEGAFEAAWEVSKLAAALDGLGCVAFRRGDARRAEELFIKAYQVDHRYSVSLANLALLYKRNGLTHAAQRLYVEAIARNPRNFKARNNFGVLLSDIQELPQAGRLQLLRAAALKRDALIENNLRSISEK